LEERTLELKQESSKIEVSSTVIRAIKILNYLHDSSGPKSLTDISKDLKISTTVIHRLLATLKSVGYVLQDPHSRLYSMGTIFLDYANKLLLDMPIIPIINPWLIKVRELTGETVGFYVLKGTDIICASEYESIKEIRHSVGVGKNIPIHLGASGRVILAYLPSKLVGEIIKLLPMETRDDVLKKLQKTKQSGYSTNEGELTPNVSALSLPVFDDNNRFIGALSISGPQFRWNTNAMQPMIPKLLKVTKEISKSF
jgi:DNA-binding IclR family transcriptional regulator